MFRHIHRKGLDFATLFCRVVTTRPWGGDIGGYIGDFAVFAAKHLGSRVIIEGGEYDVFESAPDHVFAGIHNIVFEYHPIQGYEPRLRVIEDRLISLGYRVHRHGSLVTARRPSLEKRRG